MMVLSRYRAIGRSDIASRTTDSISAFDCSYEVTKPSRPPTSASPKHPVARPATYTVLKHATRSRRGHRRAKSRIARVPSTFAARASLNGRLNVVSAAQCTISVTVDRSSAASAGETASDAPDPRSPRMNVTCAPDGGTLATVVARVSTTTVGSPVAANRDTSSRPNVPVPPVTRMVRLTRGVSGDGSGSVIALAQCSSTMQLQFRP
jgi:hypothetical protein